MRFLLAVCMLAGCYQPATESCYYQCATQGKPCPSGLECVAGMCATPGETCSPIGDGGPDIDGNDIDGPAPACGDGIATRGEICYHPARTYTGPGVSPSGGMLADWNGDGSDDLLYIAAPNVYIHLNAGSALSPTTLAGPPASTGTVMLARNIKLTTPSAELMVSSNNQLFAYEYTSGTYSQLSASTASATALAFGDVTGGPQGDLIAIIGTRLRAYTFDSSFSLVSTSNTPTLPGSTQLSLAAGRLDGDQAFDAVVGSNAGIHWFRGMPSGFSTAEATGVTSPVSDTDLGDVDGDGHLDIAYVVESPPGSPGQRGVIRGMGNGTFGSPISVPITDLGSALALRDLDGDNRAEAVFFRTGNQRALVIARGAGAGMFDPPLTFPLPGSGSVELSARGDINGDSVTDIVVTDSLGGTLYVYLSNP